MHHKPMARAGQPSHARRYDYAIALRSVETIDFMAARWRTCCTNSSNTFSTESSMKCVVYRA